MTDDKNEGCDTEDEEVVYTCKECGEHDFIVKVCYTTHERFSETQKCTCGKSENGLAYQEIYDLITSRVDAYYLDAEHRIEEKADEYGYDLDVEDIPDKEMLEEEYYCRDCFEPTLPCDVDGGSSEDYEINNEEFFVICGNCEREIEFGWSHPGRGGRIWPVECNDFNPWLSWPEPRYREKWGEKNWLRPSNR